MIGKNATIEALAQESAVPWFFLLDIKHSSFGTKYLVNNTEPIISNGQKYEPYIFQLHLSINEESKLPDIAFVMDNVDRLMMKAIRSDAVSPSFIVRLILGNEPDVYEAEIYGLSLLEVSYDAYTLQGTLYLDDFLSMRYPVDAVSTVSGFNGLFRR